MSHKYDTWIFNRKDVETWADAGGASSPEEALQKVIASLTQRRRVKKHLQSPKEIYIVIRCVDDFVIVTTKLPLKIFLRMACADYGLSSAESNVMLQLMKTSSIDTIAARLHIAAGTVCTHRRNIYGKLNVHDRGSAIHKITERARELMGSKDAE